MPVEVSAHQEGLAEQASTAWAPPDAKSHPGSTDELLRYLKNLQMTRKTVGHSGVTIASGFDLGSKSVGDLKALGLPTALVETLTPYLGLKLQDAVNKLSEKPLSISGADAALISSAAHAEAMTIIRRDEIWKQISCNRGGR